ncbi:MAG TPA: hypothetical protein VK324_18005 [Tepidisphaeraceae bacterium]|nr:hypothetical protein [Tepidisphaeraceae bacterium]
MRIVLNILLLLSCAMLFVPPSTAVAACDDCGDAEAVAWAGERDACSDSSGPCETAADGVTPDRPSCDDDCGNTCCHVIVALAAAPAPLLATTTATAPPVASPQSRDVSAADLLLPPPRA